MTEPWLNSPALLIAVQSADLIQREMAARNAQMPQDRRIDFRIGIHLGDVILEGDDIYGDGVNVAARLEALAEPGGVCVSGAVHDAIGNKLPIQFEYMGQQHVKNIDKSVRAFRLCEPPGASAQQARQPVRAAPQSHPNLSLAVKPFDNLSNDPEQDQIADGLSNGILAALTRVPGLTLISDESPALRRSKRMTVQELAQSFDVQYVLKGSLRKLGNRMRVIAELMQVSSGQVIWADQFDRQLDDLAGLFDIQDEITEEIVTAMDVKLLSGEAARWVRRCFSK